LLLTKIPTFPDQNKLSTRQKPLKTGLLTSIPKTFLDDQCFFLDIFMPFSSPSKMLSDDIKTKVIGDQNSRHRHITLTNSVPISVKNIGIFIYITRITGFTAVGFAAVSGIFLKMLSNEMKKH
jgi:hypothetical protein